MHNLAAFIQLLNKLAEAAFVMVLDNMLLLAALVGNGNLETGVKE